MCNLQNTIVCEFRDLKVTDTNTDSRIAVPELSQIFTRSKAMVTCYPEGSFYTKHYDNAIGNGRKLTTILYLNDRWTPAHGGELKLYHRHFINEECLNDKDFTLVPPHLGRLLMFWSDKRCPHEVQYALRPPLPKPSSC